MSVRVVVPKHLRRFLDHQAEVVLEAEDLRAALEMLARDHGLDGVLLTSAGDVQAFIRLIVDEELLVSRKSADLSRVAVDGKTVEIQSAFAGG